MKAKSLVTTMALAAATITASAQSSIPGTTITFLSLDFSGSVTFDGSDLQLGGTFSAYGGTSIGIPTGSTVFPNTIELTGLSSTPTPENISGYLVFSGFDFNLTSISEAVSSGDVEVLGSGILVPASPGTYLATPATFSFSSSDGSSPAYGIAGSVVTPTPEPGTLALVGVGAGALVLIRRRK